MRITIFSLSWIDLLSYAIKMVKGIGFDVLPSREVTR